MVNLPFIKRKKVEDYKYIELEAENLKLQQSLIEELKAEVKNLRDNNTLLQELIRSRMAPIGQPQVSEPLKDLPKSKPRLRTISELRNAMEAKSLAIHNAWKEDPNDEEVSDSSSD